jgi:hypothetical protein
VTDELPVHVSRDELHSLDVPASFEAEGPFDVVLVNHDEAVHVHLYLDDALSEVASIDASNHYIDGESRRAVRVHVDTAALPDQPVPGKLKLASGYGAHTRWVDVELSPPDDGTSEVEIDESLASPPAPDSGGSGSSLLARPELPVLGLGVLALAAAAFAAAVLGDTLVVLGALAVLAGVLVALSLLLR